MAPPDLIPHPLILKLLLFDTSSHDIYESMIFMYQFERYRPAVQQPLTRALRCLGVLAILLRIQPRMEPTTKVRKIFTNMNHLNITYDHNKHIRSNIIIRMMTMIDDDKMVIEARTILTFQPIGQT